MASDTDQIEIIYNGQKIYPGEVTLFELCQPTKHHVVILNGFQTDTDQPLKNGDLVTVIEKGVFPPEEQLEMMMAARHTPHVHEHLKKGCVAIAGLGGLGSNIAMMLARIGVGHLLLVDFDIVEPSNLNRQHYFIRHLGQKKTEALKQQIQEVNPFIDVLTKHVRVTSDNVLSLFKDYPIVCEAFDRPDSKALLVNTLLENIPDTWIVAASGMAGYESSNMIRTKKLMSHLIVCGDFTTEAREGQGLMAPRVQICAGHQANMILRLLLGQQNV